ncbi:hypothetical protein BDN67DRAFT_1004285 [Paxillus ammoniavirescens]|nr:hypothetical protein BDN67DRAFT_1004285 [Paxillus ammoniavirescens]
MQFFLTLLASIASLSTYTHVGAHAKCGVCPSKVSSESLTSHCVDKYSDTVCYYKSFNTYCAYDTVGHFFGGHSACPKSVAMTSRFVDDRAEFLRYVVRHEKNITSAEKHPLTRSAV